MFITDIQKEVVELARKNHLLALKLEEAKKALKLIAGRQDKANECSDCEFFLLKICGGDCWFAVENLAAKALEVIDDENK